MIQDTSASPEMYLAKTPAGACGGWGVGSESEGLSSVDYRNLRECSVLWATSVPGETAWCTSELDGVGERWIDEAS